MNAVAEIVRPTEGDLILAGNYTPLAVLTDGKTYSEFYERLRRMAAEFEPDVTTEKGRKAIASLAHKVARTKTAIDDAGKKLNEEARAKINAVDESRRKIREQLDELKAEVRRPLTDWEAAEEAREEKAREELGLIRGAGNVDFSDTTESVQARIDWLEALAIDDAIHCEQAGIANAAKADALAALRSAHERLAREEAERAELEQLRAERAEQERIEAERAAEAAEAERQAEAEKAEQERIAALEREAEERARWEAEEKAAVEREAAERAHAEALAAERKRAEEAERAAQAERDRIAREEAERAAEAERVAAAERARAADREHRGKIMGAAKEAIMEVGVTEPIAKAIVLAIAAGNVPNVSIKF